MNKKVKPWQTVKSTEVYKNPWISVYHDETIQPNGKPGIYGKVKVAKHGARIIAVNNEQKLLFNYEYRYTIGRWGYELPAGGIDNGNSSLEAAKLELLQETGLRAKSWQKLPALVTWPSVVDLQNDYYIATDITGELHQESQEDNEAIQGAHWYSLDEVSALIKEGEIFCSETISGLYLYHIFNE